MTGPAVPRAANRVGRPRARRRFPWGEAVAVPLILLGLFWAVFGMSPWAFLAHPAGRDVPRVGPDEARRVAAPGDGRGGGVSLVFPPGWVTRVGPGSRLSGSPGSPLARRHAASISLAPAAPPAGPANATFQGARAWRTVATDPGTRPERPDRYACTFTFARSGRWYALTYQGTEAWAGTLPPTVRAHLDTFRLNTVRPGP